MGRKLAGVEQIELQLRRMLDDKNAVRSGSAETILQGAIIPPPEQIEVTVGETDFLGRMLAGAEQIELQLRHVLDDQGGAVRSGSPNRYRRATPTQSRNIFAA